MSRAMLVISLVLAPVLGGCSSPAAFTCAEDPACDGVGPGARCEANGWCSFMDEACPGGHRYGDHAGDELGGTCVAAETGTDGTSAGPVTTIDEPPLDDSGSGVMDTGADETTGSPQSDWWDCGWLERRELTLEAPATSETLMGVPVLVVLDPSRIDASIMTPLGGDLRFVADDGATVLPHEIEEWNATGVSWVWVRLPELHAGTNRLHMYYGNLEAPLVDAVEVWSDYAGVWHMGFEHADATGLSSVEEFASVTDAGQVASAQRFDGSFEGVSMVAAAQLDGLFASGGTVSAMIRASGWGGGGQGVVVRRAEDSSGEGGWVIQLDGARAALRFSRGFAVDRRTWVTASRSLSLHTWHHVAVVYQDDLEAEPSIYIDGSLQGMEAQGNGGGRIDPDDEPKLDIGGEPFSPAPSFDGLVDEVRVAPLPRSADWMTVQVASLRDELVHHGAPQSATCPDVP